MPDLDRSIQDQLRRGASRVQLPAGDLDTIVARGRRRQRRQRGVVSLATLLVAGAVTGGVLSRSGAAHTTEVHSGGGGSTPTPGATGSARLQWSAQAVASDLGYATTLTPGPTNYALSTGVAAGTAQAAPGLWRSTNGLAWEAAGGPQGLYLGDLSTSGATVYAVGTGTATAATGDLLSGGVRVASSTDQGKIWGQIDLPLNFGVPAGVLTVGDDVLKVAAGTHGVVAVVTAGASLNLAQVLPAGVTAGHWTTTATGVELLGPERLNPCGPGQTTNPPNAKLGKAGATVAPTVAPAAAPGAVGQVACYSSDGTFLRNLTTQQAYPTTGSFSWAQLHLGPEAVDAVRGEPIAFFSADGKHFSQVTLPSGGGAAQSLVADGNGFVMATDNDLAGTATVFGSPDGRNWTAYPLPADVMGVLGAGTVGGKLLAVAETSTTTEVLVWQGSAWTPLQVPGLAVPSGESPQQNVANAAFGPLGVALIVDDFRGESATWQVLYSPDGSTWSAGNLATLSGGPVTQVATLSMDTNGVQVTVQRPVTKAGGKSPEVALTGTPATKS